MNFARAGSLYSAASASALLGLCALDVVASAGPRDAKFALVLAAIALGIGALHGMFWALCLGLSGRLPLRIRAVLWLLVSTAGTGLVAQSLNAFSRLRGRYRTQAILVLVGCGLCALVLSALVVSMHGRERSGPGGWALRLRGRRRAAAVAALFAAAAVVTLGDRTLYAELYPQAHRALAFCVLWLSMFGLVLALHGRRVERVPFYAWVVVVPLALGGAAFGFKSGDVVAMHAFARRPWSAFVLDTSHRLTDVDADGYSAMYGGSDCRPFDRRVHPGAHEVRNNGIDDNCILGDARSVVSRPADVPIPTDPSPIDVVLITVDSLRADHMGVYSKAYGPAGRQTTPKLDAYAARNCVVFERAYSSGGGTSVALPSLLRGRYARRLRWTRYYETSAYTLVRGVAAVPPGQSISSMFPLAYDDPSLSVSEWLLRRGMHTVAVLDDGFSEMLARGTGIERGFARFLQTDDNPVARRNDRGTAEALVKVLRKPPKDKRLFVWSHFFGPHAPNENHADARVYGTELADGYDNEINYLDDQLARVLSVLEKWPRPLAVFFTADHGDVLANGRYHGYTLRDDVTRVPLLACVSGWKPGRVARPVSGVDILPTILALTRTPAPNNLDGIDLTPLAEGRAPEDSARILLSDSWLFSNTGAVRINLVSARDASDRLTKDLVSGLPAYDPPRPEQRVGVAESQLLRWIDAYLEETGGVISLRN